MGGEPVLRLVRGLALVASVFGIFIGLALVYISLRVWFPAVAILGGIFLYAWHEWNVSKRIAGQYATQTVIAAAAKEKNPKRSKGHLSLYEDKPDLPSSLD
jgi:hypothetical protein